MSKFLTEIIKFVITVISTKKKDLVSFWIEKTFNEIEIEFIYL